MIRTSRKTLQVGQRIRVLVVDDSVVIRSLLTRALESDPDVELVGVAANGRIALARIPLLNPDVVTLDVEMPEMDGLEACGVIRREYPDIRVVMFSTVTERGASVTLEALTRGADDYISKDSCGSSPDGPLVRLRQELIPKIKQFFLLPARIEVAPPSEPARSQTYLAVPPAPHCAPLALGIGVSTGGPSALGQLLPEIPASFPLPVLVVQHMPPLFTKLLADRLQSSCHLAVHEARDGELVEPGKILLAPGDFHMKTVAEQDGVRIRLDQGPQQNSCRPATDALFTSLAQAYGGAVTAVVLTGMGQDGLRGTRILREQGAYVIVQDEATSVVWGMPGAVANAGLADAVLPLDRVAAAILQQARRTHLAPTENLWRS